MVKTLDVYALNIAATPHPAGIYVEVLREASHYIVQARGSDFAKITTPRKYSEDDRFFTGRILVWTEIDKRGRWLSLTREEDLPPEIRAKINIPDDAKPNYRVFNYVWDNDKHVLYFEGRNEFDETFGPTTGRRIFKELFTGGMLSRADLDFAVTLIPEETAVSRILDVPRLRTLTIRISRPNPDGTDTRARRRVFRELADANAKQVEVTYTKAAGAERLVPTPNMRQQATLGAQDGFVRAAAYDINGRRKELSTDEFPKKHIVEVEGGGSFVSRLLATLGFKRR